MKKVSLKDKVYAIYDHVDNPKNEVTWYGEKEDYLQASKMGFDVDREFRTHKHIPRPREIPYTQEAIVVISGVLEAKVYDDNKNILSTFLLYNGSIGIFYHGYHGFKSMADNTVFYEIKHGQFVGVKEDKVYL